MFVLVFQAAVQHVRVRFIELNLGGAHGNFIEFLAEPVERLFGHAKCVEFLFVEVGIDSALNFLLQFGAVGRLAGFNFSSGNDTGMNGFRWGVHIF